MGEPSPLDAKLLLFLYIVTAPALIRAAGVPGDPRGQTVATALALVATAAGAAMVAYGRTDPGVRTTGYLLTLAGLTTLASVRLGGAAAYPGAGGEPAPHPLPGGHPPGFEPMAADGDEQVVNASYADQELDDAVIDAATSDAEPHPALGAFPEPDGAEAMRRGCTRLVEGEAAAAAWEGAVPGEAGWKSPGSGPSADALDRIFSAPSMSEFMEPSDGGFVTREGLDIIQSNAPGGDDLSASAIAPLGPGSYTAQGVIRESGIAGLPGGKA